MAGLGPAIHDLLRMPKDVDARPKAGHDMLVLQAIILFAAPGKNLL